MKMYYYGTGGSGWVDRWLQAHQILVNWAEAQATSVNRLTGTAWNVAHVGLNDIDAKSSYESTLFFYLVGGQQVYGWKSWDLTSLTQKWVSGTATNYGVVLWATNETTDGKDLRFYSSEAVAPNDVNRPYLEVIYSQQAKTVYFLKDHLGSVRATVQDTIGAPVRGYDDYDPWGYILAGRSLANSVLPVATRNRFTGKERDDDFGVNWDYFGARYYDPQIVRWMVRDPLAKKYPSLSPYVYVANNPLVFFDPDGKVIRYRGTSAEVRQLRAIINKISSTSAGKEVVTYLDKTIKEDINLQFGKIDKKQEGRDVLGLTEVKFVVSTKDNKVVDVEFGGATITIESGKKHDVVETSAHELRHADQAAKDPKDTFDKTLASEESKTPHDNQQLEEDADFFASTVKDQLKEQGQPKQKNKKQ